MQIVLRVLSEAFFHVLVTFRRPVIWVLRGLAGLSMFAALFYGFAAGDQLVWELVIMFFLLSVVSAALAWYYNALLFRLCPPGVTLHLPL